ncbi:MAG: sel1 repeat family protein, partial [Lentisphaeria bacterium]|nr:sel1 repeat family protein [Lentisphaeria bacterium]
LGNCYFNGWGVEENKEEAVKWYRKAAEQGNTYAMAALSGCYMLGEGVNENKAEGIKWLRKSAKLGNPESKKILKRLGL